MTANDPARDFRFDGMTAAVTGAGRGMGREIALALGARGARVIATDIDGEACAATADAIVRGGGSARGQRLDIADIPQLRAFFRTLEEPLDIAVCAAAILKVKPFFEHEEEDWDALARVNLKGTFFSVQEAARHMAPRGKGSIVTFSSTSAFVASRVPEIAYDVTKGGIRQLTVSAAVELAPLGIRVNGVSGAVVETGALEHFPNREEMLRDGRERTPAGRLLEPQDLANAVAWLAGTESAMVIGHEQMISLCWSLPAKPGNTWPRVLWKQIPPSHCA